jgi:hypothetical protein
MNEDDGRLIRTKIVAVKGTDTMVMMPKLKNNGDLRWMLLAVG